MERSEPEQSIEYSPSYKTLQALAERFPDKVFIQSIDQNKSITYGQIYRV